ncbi:hypothetical protein DFJ73DRAFT_895939 [Zopfochytrium polystomum]|nr:hypothetical protein DFJ73DRAFT_895939 [Zopfochytrium polystomum]
MYDIVKRWISNAQYRSFKREPSPFHPAGPYRAETQAIAVGRWPPVPYQQQSQALAQSQCNAQEFEASPVAAPAPSPAVTEVIGAGEFREALNARGFSTSWARPCRAALPPFAALAEKYARAAAPVSFLRVDVDELDDVAGAAGVVDAPTFVVYRGGAPVATVVGAFVGRVEEEVAKWLL